MDQTPAAAESRTLDLYYTHTKERLTITYKKNGRFVPSALKELNRFLRDWRRNEPTNMDPRLFDAVWEVYRRSGARQPVHVVSAYRSLATNNMLRSRSKAVAKHSQHTLGKAMDFFLPDVKTAKLRELGIMLQQGGVGYYPSANNPFVHIDVGSVRAWPRMTRAQLVRIFPDGKTVHVPSDGQPLPGYQTALAELKRKGSIARPLMAAEEGKKRKGGLLAMLFGDEEDETEELNAASTVGQSLTAGDEDDSAPVRTAKPVKPIQPAKPVVVDQPVVVAAAPRPPKAPEAPPAVNSLANAVLPPNPPALPPAAPAIPAAAPEIAPQERIVAEAPPPPPRSKPAELLALAELKTTADAEIVTASVAPSVTPRARPALLPVVEAPVVAAAEPAAPAPILLASADATTPLPEPADARQALAEVARDPLSAAAPVVMGYASAFQGPPAPAARSVAAPPRLKTARLTAPLAGFGLTEGQADPLAPLPSTGATVDPLAVLTALGEAAGLPVYDANQSAYWGAFAQLIHPNQRHVNELFAAPVTVLTAGFSTKAYPDLSAARFTGPALPRLQTMTFVVRRDMAMR